MSHEAARHGGSTMAVAAPMAVAAIDCGTNSIRLLVADEGGRPLARELRTTRLGQGVDATGWLAPEAIDRTVAALRSFRPIIGAHNVGVLRIVATSAARDARNRDDFFDAVQAELGVRPELLSGEEEGALAFAGATSGCDTARRSFVVLDIGGGSTELIVGGGAAATPMAVSLNIGSVRLTERFLSSEHPSKAELEAATALVYSLLDAAALGPITSAAQLIGVAGTPTTLAAVDLGLGAWDPSKTHHHVLTSAGVDGLAQRLLSFSVAERQATLGIPAGRADVIVGGTVILQCVMKKWAFPNCLVSETDLLDGMVAALLSR